MICQKDVLYALFVCFAWLEIMHQRALVANVRDNNRMTSGYYFDTIDCGVHVAKSLVWFIYF